MPVSQTNNVYRVTYHFEKNGKRVTDTFQDNVLASATDITTIYSVLNGNSRVPGGYNQSNLVITGIGHAAAANGVLS